MPQMFDWIFFAIMLPVPAYLVWDWMRNGLHDSGRGAP